MNLKKIGSAVLTATTVLWMVGAASLPLANAQTTASLQAQIAALLAQIQALQAQLGNSGTTTTMTYDFTSDLTVGSTGAQVTSLQTFLIAKGYLTAVSAPTGYFGVLTQAAVAKFQAANGITPSVGYFGPKTRAFVNSMSSTTSTGTGTTTTTTGVTAPATGLAVSLASTNPAAGSLISSANAGSARVPVLAVNFTAGNSGAVTLSGVNFQKTGVLSDSAVSGAYLTQNGQVVAQYNSLNSGLLSFSGLNLSIPAGQTVTLTLAIDVAGGLSAGNTTGFSLPAASDVTAWDSNNNALTANGSFPLTGNVFTVTSVTNPSLATMTITSSSVGNQVTAGTQGNIVAAYNFNVANSPVWLQNLNFHVIGSANVANLQNVKLLVNGTQVGQTLSAVPANGMADFNASAAPAKLNTGNNNVQIVADVMGSPSYFFQFEILNGYDVLAVDSQYNVPITVTNTGGIGTQVGIQQGQITVNQDANTPTGNIAKGQSGVVLAKYDIYAAGEAVKVKFLDFNIQLAGQNNTLALNKQIQNVSITDDAGNQVGTTINQPPTSNACQAGTAGYSTSTGNGVYTDCFGTSASPINYIVAANTTRVLSLKADIQTTASFSTVTANLTGNTGNLQGMTSSQTGNTSGVNGVSLTLVSSSLNASQNNALGTQNVSAGTTGIEIGSYAFSASSAEGVNVNTVSVQLTPGTTTAAFQNLKLLVNGTQFGTTQGVVSGNTTYSFSGSAFNIPAGQTVNVNVYADSLSAASGTYTPATGLVGYTGTGAISYTSITIPTGVTGGCSITQGVCGQSVSFNGNPALTIAADSSNPPAGQIVQNSTGNTLAVFRFTETSNVENVKVTQLNVVDAVASTTAIKAAFSNLKLYNGSTLLGTAQSPVADAAGTGYIYSFTGLTNLVVPQGNSVSLTLKGDAGSFTNGSLTDNTTSTFTIATTTDSTNNTTALAVVARGATSNKTAVTTLTNASGNAQTTLRSTLAVAGSSVTSLPPASFQQIGSITFTSNAAGDNKLNSLKLTLGGAAASSSFINSLVLKDPSGNDIVLVDGLATTSTVANVSYTWTFNTSTAPLVVTAGSSYTLTLWGNLGLIPAVSNQSQALTASIAANTDFSYLDGSNGVVSTVNLTPNQVPLTIANLQTGAGGVF